MKRQFHHKSSNDPDECPQSVGETWRYWYDGDYLVVVTVEEEPRLHDVDGWKCLVLHGGSWDYAPGWVSDWAISRDGWEKVT